MDVVLALIAAMLFALGTVLQQRAGMDEPEGGSDSGLLLRMVSCRVSGLKSICASA